MTGWVGFLLSVALLLWVVGVVAFALAHDLGLLPRRGK